MVLCSELQLGLISSLTQHWTADSSMIPSGLLAGYSSWGLQVSVALGLGAAEAFRVALGFQGLGRNICAKVSGFQKVEGLLSGLGFAFWKSICRIEA